MITALLVATAALAAEPRTFEMQAPEDIWDVAFEDITGNGWKEIITLGRDEDSESLEKFLSVFVAEGDEVFSPHPTHRLALPESMGAAFFAQTRPEGPRDLVIADAEELTVLRFDDGAFIEIERRSLLTLLPTGAARPSFLPHASQDLTGDGPEEWLLPVPGGFAVMLPDGEVSRVKAEVSSGISGDAGGRVTHRLPVVLPYSADKDGPKDLAFLGETFVDFAMGPRWQSTKRILIPDSGNQRARRSPQIKDLNGNGLPDIIVTESEGNLNLRMRTLVYKAEAPGVYPERPSRVFEARGAYGEAFIADVDGDGRLDVVYIQIPVNVNFFVNYFLRQRVGINADVYLQRERGFSDDPDMRTRLTITAPDDEELAYTLGDFNGDGRVDAAFGEDDQLAIFVGERDRFISRRPWVTVDIPPFGNAKTTDITGNGRDDIVLSRPSQDDRRTIRVVLF